MFNFFTKELHDILSGFHTVNAELESFVSRVENIAHKKLEKASQYQQEAADHLDEVAKAKAVKANIEALLTPTNG